MKKIIFSIFLLATSFGVSQPSTAMELTLVGQPSFDEYRANLVYSPLVEYLNQVTEHTITLQTPRDFTRYWQDIRAGRTPELVLDDAHIMDYRIRQQGYVPLARVQEPLTFSLLTSGNMADDPLEDFVGRIISTLPAPSLGYVVLSGWYNNPMVQPVVASTAQTWRDGVEIVFAMEADAAMAPSFIAERYPNLYPVDSSEEFPGLTLAASPEVPEEVQAEIREAMLNMASDESAQAVLTELYTEGFVEASAEDYEGYADLLSVLFGM